jgi:hypothetical protein
MKLKKTLDQPPNLIGSPDRFPHLCRNTHIDEGEFAGSTVGADFVERNAPRSSSRSSRATVPPLLQSAGPHQNQCLPLLSSPLRSGLGKGRTYATTPRGKRRNTSGS